MTATTKTYAQVEHDIERAYFTLRCHMDGSQYCTHPYAMDQMQMMISFAYKVNKYNHHWRVTEEHGLYVLRCKVGE